MVVQFSGTDHEVNFSQKAHQGNKHPGGFSSPKSGLSISCAANPKKENCFFDGS